MKKASTQQKKAPVESSSDSSSEEIVKSKVPAKPVLTKKPAKPVSSDSDSDDTPVVQKKPVAKVAPVVPAKKAPVKKQESSDESSEEVPVKKAPVVQKKPEQKKAPVKQESSDDSSSEEVQKKPVAKPAAKNVVPAKPVVAAKPVAKKPVQESSSDEESSEEVPVKKAPVVQKKAPVVQKQVKKQESSEESSEEVPVKKAPVVAKKPVKKQESSSEEESSEEAPKKPAVVAKKPVKKQESSSEEESSEDEAPVKPQQKTVAQSKPAPAQAAPAATSNKEFEVRVSGLSYDASKEDIESHFNTFTTVKSVNLLTDRNTGRSKGMAFVKFHDQESLDLALQNNKTEHMGRWLNIEQAQNREERQNFQQPQSGNSSTLFIGNLSFTTEESSLQKAFSKYGNILGVRVAKDQEGNSRGFGHIDFSTNEEANAALAMAGQTVDGRQIRVDISQPKQGGGGRGGDRGGFRGGRGGGGFRGDRGGFRGGRGSSLSYEDQARKKGTISGFEGTRK